MHWINSSQVPSSSGGMDSAVVGEWGVDDGSSLGSRYHSAGREDMFHVCYGSVQGLHTACDEEFIRRDHFGKLIYYKLYGQWVSYMGSLYGK